MQDFVLLENGANIRRSAVLYGILLTYGGEKSPENAGLGKKEYHFLVK